MDSDIYTKAPPSVEYAPLLEEPESSSSSSSSAKVGPAVVLQAPLFVAAAAAPLPAGAFVAHLASLRHRRFVANVHLEASFAHEPTRWLFVPGPLPGSYLVSSAWLCAPSAVVSLPPPPSPAHLYAALESDSLVRLGFHPQTDAYLWQIEQVPHMGGVALRNLATQRLLSAESHHLRANREHCQDWELFSIAALSPQQQALPFAMPLVDPILAMLAPLRVRIASVRYSNAALGLRSGRHVGWAKSHDDHAALWDLIPLPHQEGYLIRSAEDTHLFWHADEHSGSIGTSHHADSTCAMFVVERNKHNFAIRSKRTGKYAAALSGGLVANRRDKRLWEEYTIEIVGASH